MNAERDYDLHVEHDHHTLIGGRAARADRRRPLMCRSTATPICTSRKSCMKQIDDEVHQTLKAKQIVKISCGPQRRPSAATHAEDRREFETSMSAQTSAEKVGANYSLNVGVNEDHKIGMMYNIESGMMINIKAGMSIVLDAPLGVSLTCGGNFVNHHPRRHHDSGPSGQYQQRRRSYAAPIRRSPQDPQAPECAQALLRIRSFPGDKPPSQAATSQAGAAPAITKYRSATVRPHRRPARLPYSPASRWQEPQYRRRRCRTRRSRLRSKQLGPRNRLRTSPAGSAGRPEPRTGTAAGAAGSQPGHTAGSADLPAGSAGCRNRPSRQSARPRRKASKPRSRR